MSDSCNNPSPEVLPNRPTKAACPPDRGIGAHDRRPHHWPWTFIAFTVLGTACLLAGIAALAGLLRQAHPLFGDDLAGWALIVSAVACFLTGAFPLALRRLAEREGA